MENNIENNIKKEFQNREITPSNNSWEVLNAKLEVTTSKKENKKWKFLTYAAIFIGLLFSIVTIFNSNNTEINKSTIVTIDSIKVKNPIKEQLNIKENLIKKEDSKIVKVIVKKPLIKSKKQITKNKSYIDIVYVLKKEKVVLDDKNTNIQNRNNELIAINNNPIKEEQRKIQISENQQETKINNQKKKLFSTDNDIDLMLANALSNKQSQKIKYVNIQNTYLQYHVENEVNTPIGNKILKTLKAGVDTVEEYISSNN